MTDEHWNPHYLPPATQRTREPLWTVRHAGVTWSAELLASGDGTGWEAQILRDGELFTARGSFATKATAVQWAEEQRKNADRGWLEDA